MACYLWHPIKKIRLDPPKYSKYKYPYLVQVSSLRDRLTHFAKKIQVSEARKRPFRCEFPTVLPVTLEVCYDTTSWLFPHETHNFLPCWMGINMRFMFRFPTIGSGERSENFITTFPVACWLFYTYLLKTSKKIMNVLKRSRHSSRERTPFCNDTHLK